MVKNPPANARDAGSTPGWGRSAEEGNDNPLQYSFFFLRSVYLFDHRYTGLIAPRHSWSSRTRDWTGVLCITRGIFNHWTTRDAPLPNPHPSIFAWKIPWTDNPGGLQSMGLQKGWTRLSDWGLTHTSIKLSILSSPWSLATTILFSVPMNLTTLGALDKWNHTNFVLLWPIYFT